MANPKVPEKVMDYDLVVAGGGTAGSICAIAAAREGLKVAVLERGSCLGGVATCAGLAEMNAAGFGGTPLYGGIEGEIFDAMIRRGAAAYNYAVPMSSNREVKVDRLRYNPEVLRIVLEEMAVSAGAALFYETTLTGTEEFEKGLNLTAMGLDETLRFRAKYATDATGNCRLVRMLGCGTVKPEADSLAVSTLGFRISGVDIPALQQAVDDGGLAPLIEDGYARGILKGKLLAFSPIPGTNDVSANVTRARLDHEDTRSLTDGVVSARTQIEGILAFAKDNVPGFSRAWLSSIASVMGVRDGRRLEGLYRLTLADLEAMRPFGDTVAIGCYPVDIHDPAADTVVWRMLPGVYSIPWRSLVPRQSRRAIVAGKTLSADEKAFAAVRVIPIAMNVGEAAGYAAAYAHSMGVPFTDVDGEALHGFLRSKGLRFTDASHTDSKE